MLMTIQPVTAADGLQVLNSSFYKVYRARFVPGNQSQSSSGSRRQDALSMCLTLAVAIALRALKERNCTMWLIDSATSMVRLWKVCSMACNTQHRTLYR